MKTKLKLRQVHTIIQYCRYCWIIKISTPAAAVAVCSGALMRKFSFGDEEKIRTGKKLITGSLFSYAFILAIDLVLSAIQSLVG